MVSGHYNRCCRQPGDVIVCGGNRQTRPATTIYEHQPRACRPGNGKHALWFDRWFAHHTGHLEKFCEHTVRGAIESVSYSARRLAASVRCADTVCSEPR